ncbi:MAG: glycosyltransferase [Bacteroidota bacterium]
MFFQNPDDRDLFLEKKLVPAKSTDLLPGSGIDLKRFMPGPYKRNDKFTFLLISRLITDKGVLEYVDAVKKLKAQGIDANFQILGAKDPRHQRGISLSVIDQWIDSNTIEYLGTTEDVRPFIKSADCIVLPPIGRVLPTRFWKLRVAPSQSLPPMYRAVTR